MQLHTLLYTSAANFKIEQSHLLSILKTAREFNTEHNITGLLLYHAPTFMQALEGDRDIIFKLFKKIALDERHTSVDLTYDEPITTRMFPNWSMGFHLIDDSNASTIEGFSLFLKDGFKDNSIEIKQTLISTFLLNFKDEVT